MQGTGIPKRAKHNDDSKRGSDSLLEAKIKDNVATTKSRSLTNRAQSLDLTYSLSRVTGASSRLPPPESPDDSEEHTPGNSSATSSRAPSISFPSVYAGSSISGGAPVKRPEPVLDDDVVEEVSRVISNLGL